MTTHFDRLRQAEALLLEESGANAPGDGASSIDSLIAKHPDFEDEFRALESALAAVNHGLASEAVRFERSRVQADAILDAARDPAVFSERYLIESEIGRGGMGVVLRVLDRKLDRPMAMKVIGGQAPPSGADRVPAIEPRQLARFLEEAKITGRLDHPGIVPVHEVGVDNEGRAYFTMKLVKGLTLAEVFARREASDRAWPTPRVLAIIERVCEAMTFAHRHGVIHRDLKPANIMVGDFGEVYVMDWGLARRVGGVEKIAAAASESDAELDSLVSRTRDGDVVGTPAYMSPEQARGDIASMGPHSDVYSLGAMLYQLIAGTPPHVEKGERVAGAAVWRER